MTILVARNTAFPAVRSHRNRLALRNNDTADRRSSARALATAPTTDDDRVFLSLFLDDPDVEIAGYALFAALETSTDLSERRDRAHEVVVAFLRRASELGDVEKRLLKYACASRVDAAVPYISDLLTRSSAAYILIEALAEIGTDTALACIESYFQRCISRSATRNVALELRVIVTALARAGRRDALMDGLATYGRRTLEDDIVPLTIDVADSRVFDIVYEFIDSEIRLGYSVDRTLRDATVLGRAVLTRYAHELSNINLATICGWPDTLRAIVTTRDEYDESVHWKSISLVDLRVLAQKELDRRTNSGGTELL